VVTVLQPRVCGYGAATTQAPQIELQPTQVLLLKNENAKNLS
jgi:hypothetical protein